MGSPQEERDLEIVCPTIVGSNAVGGNGNTHTHLMATGREEWMSILLEAAATFVQINKYTINRLSGGNCCLR
jgi:hypothetical protein